MRVTIITEDDAVIIDGVHCTVDCSSLASDIHAIQWYGDFGEVEFKTISQVRQQDDETRIIEYNRKPNKPIHDKSMFKVITDLWKIERENQLKKIEQNRLKVEQMIAERKKLEKKLDI